MDILDKAKALEEGQLERALAFRFVVPIGPARDCCLECDEPIPPARIKAVSGCQLCLDCQQGLERMQKNGNF